MTPRQDSTDAEIETFVQVCDRLAGFDDRDPSLSAEWIDGYLTAVAAGPLAWSVEQWLPALGGEAFARCFADPEDERRALQALEGRLKVLRAQLEPERLLDFPDEMFLVPLLYPWDDAARQEAVASGSISEEDARDLLTGVEWALGFLHAVSSLEAGILQGLPPEAAEEHAEMLEHVGVLAAPMGTAGMDDHMARHYPEGPPSRDDLIDTACFVVQDLRVWWLEHAPRPATRRVEAAPGRNDPCPCGSGRKFKKCCGAAAG